MDWGLWAGFVAASLVVGLLPGPGVTSIVGYALTAGLRTALASVFGATVGNSIAMTLSLVGLGVLLGESPAAFAVLKWAGAFYLIAMGLYGIATARRGSLESGEEPRTITPRAAFWGTVAITAVNPKTIIFFVAFTPQFMSPQLAYWPQALILLLTFAAVVTTSDGFYALGASKVTGYLKGDSVKLWSQRIGGAVLVAAGLMTAFLPG